MILAPLTACRVLYWLLPAPYADGEYEVAGLIERPLQLEYG